MIRLIVVFWVSSLIIAQRPPPFPTPANCTEYNRSMPKCLTVCGCGLCLSKTNVTTCANSITCPTDYTFTPSCLSQSPSQKIHVANG